MSRFATWDNGEHLHSGIRFVAPNTRHAGQDQTVLAARASLWAKARAASVPPCGRKRARPGQNDGRDSPRNWTPVGDVWLNPERDNDALKIRDAA